jgi:hypothetical protein
MGHQGHPSNARHSLPRVAPRIDAIGGLDTCVFDGVGPGYCGNILTRLLG